ncbi:hypothetical protein IV203_018706 [Nitzschia inconspicua]|uniref:Uncharacterized protein n=1 Tax=Nitzschia inconspicua TaxID=303405 RepID=A0A9K3M1L5_9STRA|nr:hypothetical protein IV203_018706 [Nitzschia inconspicua]
MTPVAGANDDYHDSSSSSSSSSSPSKILELDDLDLYFTSLLIGPSLSPIFQEALMALQVMYPTKTDNNNNNNNKNNNSRSKSTNATQYIQQALQTLIQSASWQTALIQGMTILLNQGASSACQTFGVQVVERKQSSLSKRFGKVSSSWKSTILLFALFHSLLPQLYRTLKEHLLSQNDTTLQQQHHQDFGNNNTDPTNLATSSCDRYRIALQRRRQVLKKFFQLIDSVLPLLRLGLLLNFWRSTTTTNEHHRNPFGPSPHLAMTLLGLGYATVDQSQSGIQNFTTHLPISTNPPSYFVLYAYRRWVHQELWPLWRMVGSPIFSSASETFRMIRHLFEQSSIVDYWTRLRQEQRRRRQRRRWQNSHRSTTTITGSNEKKHSSQQHYSSRDDACCLICGIETMVVPYECKDCGHVSCYTCLWEHVFSLHKNHPSQKKRRRRQQHVGDQVSSSNTAEYIHCPVCYEPIQHCSPL